MPRTIGDQTGGAISREVRARLRDVLLALVDNDAIQDQGQLMEEFHCPLAENMVAHAGTVYDHFPNV